MEQSFIIYYAMTCIRERGFSAQTRLELSVTAQIESDHEINQPSVLFQRVQDEDIEEERQSLRKHAAKKP